MSERRENRNIISIDDLIEKKKDVEARIKTVQEEISKMSRLPTPTEKDIVQGTELVEVLTRLHKEKASIESDISYAKELGT